MSEYVIIQGFDALDKEAAQAADLKDFTWRYEFIGHNGYGHIVRALPTINTVHAEEIRVKLGLYSAPRFTVLEESN